MLLDTTLPEIFVFLYPVENILNYIRDKTAGCGRRFASGDGRFIIYQMCPTRKKYLSLVLHYFNIPHGRGDTGPVSWCHIPLVLVSHHLCLAQQVHIIVL